MEASKKLIRNTKKKFFIYSFFGISLVALVSYFAVSLHMRNVRTQSSIQEMYSMITKQLSLVSKISLLSEKFDSEYNIPTVEFRHFLKELNSENEKLNNWFSKNDLPSIDTLENIIKDNNVNSEMLKFIKRARTLVDNEDISYREIRRNIQFLTNSSRDGLIGILTLVGQKLQKEQAESLLLFNKMGFILVALSILQVILIWLLVFRPLHLTILTQHEKISDALLRAKSASRSKTDFLANISHEIRTPMTAIIGYADLLKRDNVSLDEKRDAAKVIDQNASHLLGLIDEILDISKIEAGKFDFEDEEVHLTTFLNEVYSLINVKSEENGIDLRFKNDGKIPEYIMTDPKRLKQILFNILGNSIKFTEVGFVELVVSYLKKDNALILRVSDSGIGIPPEKVDKLFKPFEQGDTSVARHFGGTGLGLVLSKGLARGMGGDVRILSSKVNVGTAMEVVINIGEPKTLELMSSFSTNIIDEKKSEIDINALTGKSILVVDDAKENARLFKLYLSEAGAEVEIANDGQAALDISEKKYFDLILLDLQMPGKDGFQVIEQLRKRSFDRPIVALTAHAMKEEKEKTKEAGFNDHITKPVSPELLINSVLRLVTN
ncbi:hybrid sensor histidine kinase/response regulator [Halobacteriovorax sp.]|uniref:ATP-binding response regulator n=1 Tax=Halobacteriovorax sp. TaxID=2020862 RepID=UPI00356411F8